MATAIGVRDEAFLEKLQAAGYTADSVVLAELTPQIQIAWADDRVSPREREVILETAAHRGVPPHSRAHVQLAGWLEHRPSEHFFRVSRDAIRRIFQRLPAHVQVNVRRSLLEECVVIASASGGFLGWRSVSFEERHLIDDFAAALDCREPAGSGMR